MEVVLCVKHKNNKEKMANLKTKISNYMQHILCKQELCRENFNRQEYLIL